MSTLRNHPHIELVKRDKLKPNSKNPRRHSDKQIAQIAGSIDRFGFVVPIICDDDGLIVAGAGRWAAAALRGLDEVPAIRVRFVSEADRRAPRSSSCLCLPKSSSRRAGGPTSIRCPYLAHRYRSTLGDLVDDGYAKGLVYSITGSDDDLSMDAEKMLRDADRRGTNATASATGATQRPSRTLSA